jgi:Holliday junction DNA helicase RuvA
MIDYIKGILAEKNVNEITVEANGIGYAISVPLSTFEKLPEVNKPVKIHTHFHVREDAQRLFGFLTKSERETFDQLISINGIGPKVALSVLSGVSTAELGRAVALGDPGRLRSIPGIGPKIAQRLVMELKGKISSVSVEEPAEAAQAAGAPARKSKIKDEAFAAMLSLGYNDKQVQAALSRVAEMIDPAAPVEDWIRKALQVI